MIKLLLLEPNPEHARLMQDYLKEASSNMSFHSVSTLNEALCLLQKKIQKKGRYDCIVTEYATPEISGRTLLLKLKKGANGIPIVVVSGRWDERTGDEVIRYGATDFLQKSRSSLELLPYTIRRAILKGRLQNSKFLSPAYMLRKVLAKKFLR